MNISNIKLVVLALFFILSLLIAILFLQNYRSLLSAQSRGTPQKVSSSDIDLPTSQLPISLFQRPDPTPTVTIVPKLIFESTSSNTPDGKKSVTLKTQKNGSSTSYEAYVTEVSTGNIAPIFSGVQKESASIQIPYNTWSPDNLYFFLVDSKDGGVPDYLVYRASGEPFDGGDTSLNISEYFKQKVSNYTLGEATGWAGPYLILLNVKNMDGSEGPSFWFDISTGNFTQLSTKFY